MGGCLGEGPGEHSDRLPAAAAAGRHGVSPHAAWLRGPGLAHGHNGHGGDVPSSAVAWEKAGEQRKPTFPLFFFFFFFLIIGIKEVIQKHFLPSITQKANKSCKNGDWNKTIILKYLKSCLYGKCDKN